MICDRCGRENPDNLTFCQDCGRRLPKPAGEVAAAPIASPGAGLSAARPEDAATAEENGPVCPACRARNPGGNRFCVGCGSRLPEEATAAAAVPIAATALASNAPSVGGAPAAPTTVACPRCGGVSDASMRFCKYCGAPLAKDAGPAAAVLDRKITRPETPSALATPAPPGALASEPGRVGPVAGGAAARLVAIAKDGSEGTSWALSGETVDVGRDEGDIRLADDAFVSPRHLRLTRRSDGWHLHDLASVNGVYLRVRKPTPLVDQDLILVGLQVLRFEVVKEAEQGLGPAIQHGTQLFGSPIVPRHARLCQRSVEGITRNVFHLQRDETVIGREAGDLVFTDDPFLSRRHVTIRRDPASKAFTIEDLGSSNGTYLAMKGDVLLADGDFVRVGQHLFRFDLGGASGASPAWRSA